MSDDGSGSSPGTLRLWLEKIKFFMSGPPKDRAGLISILRGAERQQVLEADALSIIEGALQVCDMQVREIMIPRSQVVVVKSGSDPEAFLTELVNSRHSRFPVIGESLDDVMGILLAKDLLQLVLVKEKEKKRFNIKDFVRPATVVPESKRLNVLLQEFRATRNHMAIVVDEFGAMAGVVTIEDVLEQIVGEIEDEHDVDDESYIKEFDESHFVVKALMPIDEFNEHFASNFDEDDCDTIGGLVINGFGYLPHRDEQTTIGEFSFKVLNADNRRVKLLQVSVLEAQIPTISS